jgi:signal transduction histidine kinase
MNKLILIIEDSKTLAMYEKHALNEAGHNVIIANSVEKAKELISHHKKNIMICIVDINLPEGEAEILSYLLKYNIPSIAMTGSFHPELRDKIVDSNIIDYIVFEDDQNLEMLQSTVYRVINNEKRSILIVDDSNASRSSLKNLLLAQNFTIYEAADAAQALSVLRKHDNIEVALIDYEMPRMNGADLTRIIRKSFSRMELAILAISVHTKSIITIEFLKAGANDFITKPYVKEEVLARIAVNIDLIEQRKNLEKEIEERKSTENKLKISKQNAQSATIAKSNFLANMSHEIRTPMNAILGFVDVLHKGEDDNQKLEKLNIIKQSGESLMNIINDILDFSKIESGKVVIEKILFETTEPFIMLTDLFQKKADEKGISLKLNNDSLLPQKAYGDLTKIKQIYSNLLSNAIKFSKEKSSIEISIELFNEVSLLCHVKDHGIGIAKENIEKIFYAFEQENASTTRNFGGTGLGLSISKSLANAMQGDLYVESQIDQGSTFSFHVELFKDIEKMQQSSDTFEKSKPSSSDMPITATILVVEDNKANQLLMQLLLEELGLELAIANDGLEAIEAYQAKSFDLILMDENMPNLNGIEATKKIRNIEDEQKSSHIPIIAVTANALKEDKERFLASGMDDYLTKPIDAVKLESLLRKYLSV